MNTLPVMIRREYLDLMDGDHCAAAILNAFEMWSKNKPDYIYKSAAEMQSDLLGLFGLNRVGNAFLELRRRGYLIARDNPNIPTDRTKQYLFQPIAVLRSMLMRVLMQLSFQSLVSVFQTLILKSQALAPKHESESISEHESENKSKSDSNHERDRFLFEGFDDAKFFKDDPASSLPTHLRTQMPSVEVRQQLAAYAGKLGLELYAQVIARCGNARSWEYVLKALENEQVPAPYPPVPPPPPMPDETNPDHQTESDAEATPDIDVDDPMTRLRFMQEQCSKPVCELSAATILPEPAKWWGIAYSQLEIQLDKASFDMFFRNNVTLTAVEGQVWRFRVGNSYARDMLQHRLYREIRRVLSDAIGCRKDEIELVFEVAEAVTS